MTATPEEIVRILLRDLTLKEAMAQCQGIADAKGPLAKDYLKAKDIIEQEQVQLCIGCGQAYSDFPSHYCSACNAGEAHESCKRRTLWTIR